MEFWVSVERVGVEVKNVRRPFFFFGEGGGEFKVFWVLRLSWTSGEGILGMKAHLGEECMELPIFLASTQIS